MKSPLRTSASGPPIAASGAVWRTTAPYAVPLIRPSEMRTMSLTPRSRSFLGSGIFPTSGNARITFWSGALEHEDAGFIDVEIRIVDEPLHLFHALEHDSASPVVQQGRRCGRRFDDRTLRCQVPLQ